MTPATIEHDPINAPLHYISENGLEVIDIIEAYGLADSFHLANTLKYCLRAKAKDDYRENLGKALWYLRRFHFKINQEDADFAWPCALADVEQMIPIESVVREFKLQGALAATVVDLLTVCVGDDTAGIDDCIDHLELAIKEAA